MSFSIRVNNFRRKVMYGLTKNIGKSNMKKALSRTSQVEIKKILIVRPNHRLGNLLLTTPLIQEITDTFPNCEIDIIVKGNLAPILYENFSNINSYIVLPRKPFKELITYAKVWLGVKYKTYDLVINAVKDSSSGKLLTGFANAKLKVFDDIEDDFELKVPDSHHIAKNPVYTLRAYLSKLGYPKNERPVPLLDMKLSVNEIEEGKTVLNNLVKNNPKTICIYTFATGHKCHSKQWWKEFYTQLKTTFKEHNIIEVLPIENISQIDFEAPSYYSKDLREMAAVIENTSLFIGADCGVMHLAAATKTPVMGLFSQGKLEKYKPYGNYNIAIDTSKQSITDCIEAAKAIINKS
ncbi:MAG: glycosyltransferase family 9 protein [Algicola sp.]|nr:glycosyltransferase family 9 protein [Algicola sp.]